MISADLRPRRADGLAQGIVRGRRFVHNPRGFDALAVLSTRAASLLDAADGRPLGEIAAEMGVGVEALAAEVPLLARNGFVVGEGLSMRERPASAPRFDLWIHVTNACNLDCPYCYIAKDHHHLGDDTAQALIDSLVTTATARGVTHIHARFAGGEPMLRFGFIQQFFDRARDAMAAVGARFTAAILTNGTSVPEGATRWLLDRGVTVSVSLDGVGATQDAMRPNLGGGGSFERVRAGIDRLVEGGVAPYILTTVTARNLDGMPSLTAFLLERSLGFRYSLVRDLEGGDALLDARGAGWRGVVPLGRARRANGPTMLAGEALARVQNVFGECYQMIERAMPVAPSFRRTHRFCDLEINRPVRKACGAGDSYLAISDRGVVSPCQAALHHEGTAPLASNTDLATLAPTISQLGDFRRSAPNETCASCRFKHSCAGGCPLLLHRRDGDVNGRSPYCEVFRFVLPRIVRIAALEVLLAVQK